MSSVIWNPWHGCKKYSEGCKNCYVYRRDNSVGRDASAITKTKAFFLPTEKNKSGEYKIPSGAVVYACMTSDFFLDAADEWRPDCFCMMRERSDVEFIIITKRITRAAQCLPDDWGDGYANVEFVCTMENQKRCDERFPALLSLPAAKKSVTCEPLLEEINMSLYLDKTILRLVAGGESGDEARVCRYEWVLSLRKQCDNAGVPFYFKQTGARFEKDGKLFRIKRPLQHSQARKAGINTTEIFG